MRQACSKKAPCFSTCNDTGKLHETKVEKHFIAVNELLVVLVTSILPRYVRSDFLLAKLSLLVIKVVDGPV